MTTIGWLREYTSHKTIREAYARGDRLLSHILARIVGAAYDGFSAP